MTPARSFGLPRARRFAGLLALLLAGTYAFDAWQTLSFGRWHKPGAAIFPIAVAALMALSAISVLLERHGGADDPMPATFGLPDGADLRRLLSVLAAFAIYFVAMPVLGSMIASAVFQEGRYELLPDAKPIGETPWKDTFPVGYYVIAPNGLPKPILDKLLAVSKAIVESDEFKSFLKANGYTSDPKIGDDMKKELTGYDQRFREVVKFLDDDK